MASPSQPWRPRARAVPQVLDKGRFCVNLEEFLVALPPEPAVTASVAAGVSGVAFIGRGWIGVAFAGALPPHQFVSLEVSADTIGPWGADTPHGLAAAIAADVSAATATGEWTGHGCVRVRMVAASKAGPGLVAFDGSRAQAINAFSAAYPHWASAAAPVASPTSLPSVVVPRSPARGCSAHLIRDRSDARFDLARLAVRFPPLFVTPSPPGGSAAFVPVSGMAFSASLPLLPAVYATGAQCCVNLGPSMPYAEVLCDVPGNLASEAAEPHRKALAGFLAAASQLLTAADDPSAPPLPLAQRDGPLLAIAHLGGRTSPTAWGAKLHVHLSLEPADFLRFYFSTEASSRDRSRCASDIFFITSFAARRLSEQVVGGPQNLPAYEVRHASYQVSDGTRARTVTGQALGLELVLPLPAGWGGGGSDPLIVLHPRRPRLGLAIAGVSSVDGNAALWPRHRPAVAAVARRL